jgi:CRISPR-associated protein Csm1
LNNFLKEHHPFTYTVFAGGDDLMLITPQSKSVELVDSFNKKFEAFACYNSEVHVSYSITHFKDHTPIKLANVFADENQSNVKKKDNGELNEVDTSDCLTAGSNKASTLIFHTKIKNSELGNLLLNSNRIIEWAKANEVNNKMGVSMGVIRSLLTFSDMMKDYRTNKNTRKLIWHPLLTYSINRNLMSNGTYNDNQVKEFFEDILKISKNDKELAFEHILYPVLCDAIFKLRSS